MIAALVLAALARFSYCPEPHALELVEPMPSSWASVSTAPDSITYSWTLPTFGAKTNSWAPDSAAVLHSWMTSEVWRLDQFSPAWPVLWFPQRIALLAEKAPGAACSVRVPSHYGTTWVVAVGPGGRSLPSNLVDGRLW